MVRWGARSHSLTWSDNQMRGINSIILPPSKTAANQATGLPRRPRRQQKRTRRRLRPAMAGSCISSYYQNDGGFVLTSYWIFNLDRRQGRKKVWKSERGQSCGGRNHLIGIGLTSLPKSGGRWSPLLPLSSYGPTGAVLNCWPALLRPVPQSRPKRRLLSQ